MLNRRTLVSRAVRPPTYSAAPEPEYRVFVGTMTDNDLMSNACFGMVASVSLRVAIQKVHSTTRHKARGEWHETHDPELVSLAMSKPNSVFVGENGCTPDFEVFTDGGYNPRTKLKLR